MNFGELVRHYRIKAGLTEQALADRLGISVSGVAYTELRDVVPRQGTVNKYAQALGISPVYLSNGIEVLGRHEIHESVRYQIRGNDLRDLRKNRRLTQVEFARKAKILQTMVTKMENNKYGGVRQNLINRIAQALDAEIDMFADITRGYQSVARVAAPEYIICPECGRVQDLNFKAIICIYCGEDLD